MTDNRSFSYWLVCAFIFIAGLGLAIVLPLFASSQGVAAKGTAGAQIDAPKVTQRYYVAITGTGSPGTSWNNAFTNLQDALAEAENPSEIWVAEGVYYPDIGNGQKNNSVTATFMMTDGVAIYGGFEFGDTQLSDRDWEKNLTVLSGDIDGDDTHASGIVMATDNIIGENSLHVVTARNVSNTAVLDGFTITAGQANGKSQEFGNARREKSGGGFYCFFDCNPKFNNVTFSGNYAEDAGGAMYNFNWGDSFSPIFTNVKFLNNSASIGGAIYNSVQESDSTPSFINVTFLGNKAEYDGGAMYNLSIGFSNLQPLMKNVTFFANSAGDHGGAVYNNVVSFKASAWPSFYNSILWNNKDSSGIGTLEASIFNFGPEATLHNRLENSLIQGTGGSHNWIDIIYYRDYGGNIDTNPLFISDINSFAASNIESNVHLRSSSPAIDAGNNTYIAGVTTDLEGEPRIQDGDGDGVGTVDMGAYEAEAKFERHYKLNIYTTGSEFGQVLSSPAGIECGDICSLLLKENSTLTLKAFPEFLSAFIGWSGDCSGIEDCVLIMDSAKNVSARFIPLLKFPIVFR